MGTARLLLAVAVLDGNLYAVGGESSYNYLSSVERYDLAANAWEAVAPMGTERSEHGAAVLDGKLYAVGGEKENNEEDGSQLVNTVERYNPATNAWEGLAPMATARASPCVALL